MGNKDSICCTCGYTCRTGVSGEHSCVDRLVKRVAKLERDWIAENRVLGLLVAGGFVTKEKVEEARQLI